MATPGPNFVRDHWDERHKKLSGLDRVGYWGLGGYNEWMYAVRDRVFHRMLRPYADEIRGGRVLDVGSGTGFYLERWRRYEPAELVANDISPIACAELEAAFPGVKVVCADISLASPESLASFGRFRFISCMDVLFHVVDDEAYARTFRNLARLLEPGGRIVFTENFLQHKLRVGNESQICRSLDRIRGLLADAGLEIERRRPNFVVMNGPIDSDNRWLELHWQTVLKAARRDRRLAWAMGAAEFGLEVLLTKLLAESPTSEIAVTRPFRGAS